MPRPAPATEHDRLRAELVLSFDLSFIAIGLIVLIVIHYLFPLPPESRSLALLTVPMLIFGLAGSALCLRSTGRVGLAAQAAITTAFVVMVASTVFHGGIESPVLCLWILVPIVAGLLAGRRAAAVWAGTVAAFMFVLYRATHTGLFDPVPINATTYAPSLLINMSIACGSTAAAVGLYETINANLRRTLAMERARFRYQAGHDALTDLPNRRLFLQVQETALRRADRMKQKVGLFIIDLDGFKPVNDRYGHAVGDEILKVVAARLGEFTRATDSVARLGGDEFAVLVELLSSADDALLLAGRLHEQLTAEARLDTGQRLPVATSIGIALYPDHGTVIDELHEAADAAMYRAKSAGGNQFAIHDPARGPAEDPHPPNSAL